MKGLRIAACVAACITAGGVLAAVAEAKIVVGISIASVKLGDNTAHVNAALGKPDFISASTWYYFPHHAKSGNALYSVFFSHGHAALVLTSSTKERTDRGVGPGSSLSKVKGKYPKAGCETNPFTRAVDCLIHTRNHGRKVTTDFGFRAANKPMGEVSVRYT